MLDKLSHINHQTVLVSPLDWGLGHATRCIPIIEQLIENGNKVIIATDGNAAKLLREEFPSLKHIHLKGYNVRYYLTMKMFWNIFFQLPKLCFAIAREHQQLKKIIKKHQVDLVISDNRFGLCNKSINTIFITHQIMIKMPKGLKFLEPLAYKINRYFIKKYDHCWIPDYENPQQSLSGDLSHHYPMPPNAKFIGPLSRFKKPRENAEQDIDLLIILSGPEPMRTKFEKAILKQIKDIRLNFVLVRGTSALMDNTSSIPTILNIANTKQLNDLLIRAKKVLCRSGYSSVMDLTQLEKKAILVPTPGQTEQEYLAKHLQTHPNFKIVTEKELELVMNG